MDFCFSWATLVNTATTVLVRVHFCNWCLFINSLFGVSFLVHPSNFCVMLKILSSKVSEDSDINEMSVVSYSAEVSETKKLQTL